jgi:hypothetical protein
LKIDNASGSPLAFLVFVLPNRPHLIEVILCRETDAKVFRLKKA